MEKYAKEQHFERAERVKRQVLALIALQEYRLDPMLYTQKDTLMDSPYEEELIHLRALLQDHIPTLGVLSRIECIDISNFSGRQAAGSLVVLTNGVPDTNQYRRFKIQTRHPNGAGQVVPNDVGMIKEVLSRRLKHPEWKYPNLLVIDGGKPQVAAATEILQASGLTIPLIGLAKRFEEIIVPSNRQFTVIRLPLTNPAIHVLQRIRDEAHRFAKSYHIHLRKKLMSGLTAV